MDERIIQKYREDEEVMIRLFVQWCCNRDVDPAALYAAAYPTQPENPLLMAVIEGEDEQLAIDTDTLLEVLQLFGNDDLAFTVAEADSRTPKKRGQ
ncbi:hypothetical protein [Planococcus lenghuensis]|uniref:Uncharacterized protein n=1 Tax=Planococcus lenghuensis TaxID=2213202 RepID=A0A1Q2KUQ1_9BACL|nr:hypothetical protein [Planococcus lenghuensis]AQQ51921.1 hypothetical protein B0X71_01490 [Planococcus lenghuensis]